MKKDKEIVDLRAGREMENDIMLGGERNSRLGWVVKWLKSNSEIGSEDQWGSVTTGHGDKGEALWSTTQSPTLWPLGGDVIIVRCWGIGA